MSVSREDILHELISVVSGEVAHLAAARARELHLALDPGYYDEPMTDEQMVQLAELEALKARQAAKEAEPAAEQAGPAPVVSAG